MEKSFLSSKTLPALKLFILKLIILNIECHVLGLCTSTYEVAFNVFFAKQTLQVKWPDLSGGHLRYGDTSSNPVKVHGRLLHAN